MIPLSVLLSSKIKISFYFEMKWDVNISWIIWIYAHILVIYVVILVNACVNYTESTVNTEGKISKERAKKKI